MYKLNEKWSKASPMGPEVETTVVIAALVRHQKPLWVIETGCADGDTAEAIGKALQENGFGTLQTCDIDPDKVQIVEQRCAGLPVEVFCRTGESLIQTRKWGLAFIDSGWMPVRCGEAKIIKDWIEPGGLVCLHDISQNYGHVYQTLLESSGWMNLTLHAPYGLAIFQAPGREEMLGAGKMVTLEPAP